MVKITTRRSVKLSKRNRVQLFDLNEFLYGGGDKSINSQKILVKKSKVSNKKITTNIKKQLIKKQLIKKQTTVATAATASTPKKPIIKKIAVITKPTTVATTNNNIFNLSTSTATVQGSAKFEGSSTVVLTNSKTDKIGSCYSNSSYSISNGFKCDFTYSMETNGSDGLALIIKESLNTATTQQPYEYYKLLEGGQLEYNDEIVNGTGGILAIEFDTFLSDDIELPNSNNITIKTKDQTSNLLSNQVHHHTLSTVSSTNTNNSVSVSYNSTNSTISLTFNNQLIINNIIIPNLSTSPQKQFQIGFTAATGYCIQTQKILNCKFTSTN